MRLFSGNSFFDYLQLRDQHLKNAVRALSKEKLETNTDDEIIEYFKSLYSIENINLLIDQIEAKTSEIEVDVSQDQMRFTRERSEPYYIKGIKVEYFIPFEGPKDLFQFRPSSFTMSYPEVEIRSNELVFSYSYPVDSNDTTRIESRFESDKNTVVGNVGGLNGQINAFNNQVENTIKTELSARRSKLEQYEKITTTIKYPLRKIGTTVSSPIKMKPIMEKVKELRTSAPEPEYVLEDVMYDEILSSIKGMAITMERSPQAFNEMNEENIRFHFLVNLNGIFRGDATGETFNYNGKTDIIIRINNKNIFISEFKFWKGEKILSETIDQILSYTSWRDTKTAIVLLNRNRDFTNVLNQIPSIVQKHPNFIAELSKKDTEFRYKFCHKDDKNRILFITILAFEIPSK